MGSGSSLRSEPRLLGPGGRPGGPRGGSGRGSPHQLPLTAASRRDPRALHVSSTIKPPTFTTSPTPPVGTIFLCLVATVLTRSGPGGSSAATSGRGAAVEKTLVKIHGFFEIIIRILLLILLLVLPELDSSSGSTPTVSVHNIIVVHAHARRTKEGDDSDAEGRGGVGCRDGVGIGDEGLLVVVVVEGRCRSNYKHVTETNHSHLWR